MTWSLGTKWSLDDGPDNITAASPRESAGDQPTSSAGCLPPLSGAPAVVRVLGLALPDGKPSPLRVGKWGNREQTQRVMFYSGRIVY